MSDEIRARVSRFTRQTIDFHLPLLVGMMAEEGRDTDDQSRRASALVSLLRRARVDAQLMAEGRPIPVEIQKNGDGPQLVINGQMLARVDDGALAGAMAGPVARVLKISPISVGLVLQLSDENQVRGLKSQLGGRSGAAVIPLTRIGELVGWRLETFGRRLERLVEGAGGRLKAPEVSVEEFCREAVEGARSWPEWREVENTPFMTAWQSRVKGELGHTRWGQQAEKLMEMIWESLIISPRSALRQAAQTLRSLPVRADRGALLEIIADALGGDGDTIDGALESWPTFGDLQEAWEELWREEDDAIGARRRVFRVPTISVFQSPGAVMGFDEPANLPWDQPLLCWTLRERSALQDLLTGMKKTLARTRAKIRSGRLGENAGKEGSPLVGGIESNWSIQIPSRVPPMPDGLSAAVDRAFSSTRATYLEAFSALDMSSQLQALSRARGSYGGYLASTKAIWNRRLVEDQDAPLKDIFQVFLTGLANALEWPIFIDVFESGIDAPPMATVPAFTVLATWTEGAGFAPAWLPVEAIGEALGQAPLRIRNVSVEGDGTVRWLGDYLVEPAELRALSTDGLLRSVHEGTLMVTVHKR